MMPSANRKTVHVTTPQKTKLIPLANQQQQPSGSPVVRPGTSILVQTLQKPMIGTPTQVRYQAAPAPSGSGQAISQQNAAGPSGIKNYTYSGSLTDPIKIEDILKQMDPSAQLNDDVKDSLLDFINEYTEKILEKSCEVAKHRGSKTVDPKDVSFAIRRMKS